MSGGSAFALLLHFMSNLRKILGISLMAIASSVTFPAEASADRQVVTIGVYQNPPKVFLNNLGEAEGFWPDLLATIGTNANWQIDYVPCYWNRCLEMVEQGSLDLMIDVAYTAERDQRFAFNQEAVLSSWSVVYVKQGTSLSSILDLDQRRVAVLSDSIQLTSLSQQSYEFDIAPQLVEVKDFDQIYALLMAGEVDAAIVNRFLGATMERTLPVEATNILIEPSRLHVITRIGASPSLLVTFDHHLQELKDNPNSAYYEAINRWLAAPEPSFLDKLRLFLPTLAVIIAGSGLLISSLWNRSLRMAIKQRRQVEAQLQSLADNTPGVIFRFRRQADGSVQILYLSSGTMDLWELSAEVLQQDPGALKQLIAPDEVPRIGQSLLHSAQTLTPWNDEWQVTTPSGRQLWMQVIGKPQAQADGSVIWDGLVLDITEKKHQEAERKAIEASLRQSEATLRQILEAIPDLLLWTRPDGTCVGISEGQHLENLMPKDVNLSTNQYDLLPPELVPQRQEAFRQALATGEVQIYEQELKLKDIHQYEEVRIVPVEADLLLTIVRDISDRKHREIERIRNEAYRHQAEQAARESENRYRLVAENISDLVCLNDLEGRYTYVSPSCKALLGYVPEELIGRTPYEFIHPEDQMQVRREVHSPVVKGATACPFMHRVRKKDGSYIWVETLVKPILDEFGQVSQLQTTARDVTDRVKVEAQLRHAALHDSLTGLPNRSILMERLGVLLAQNQSSPPSLSALLFLDLDQFKVINDSLGHLTGDKLLVWVANKLSQVVRITDIVARISGDEFVILLEDLDEQNQAIQIAERVLEELKDPFVMEQREIFITSSIGIVLDFSPYQTAEDLVRDADIAMYQAKASGRANYALFAPQMRLKVVERMNLSNDLRRALEYQELLLYYQPIVALDRLTIESFEVLLRWQHPSLGMVSPDQFIPIAEETGLIVPIGQWLLQTACRQLASWRRDISSAQDLRVSVNLSVRQLQSQDLMVQLDQILQDSGLPANALTLEITESVLVKNFGMTNQLLSQVQRQGINISIDDFGTGYSSLSYLHRLPVDALKIDRTFVSHMGQDAKNQTIAESIIALSNVLGLNAIAEGIETAEQLHWLQDHGCEYGQGYLFSRPVPAEQAGDLLQQNFQTSIPSHHRRLPVTKTGHMSPIGPVSDNCPN
jgi:diguanylate cyclase (GGDEF)-like protein/PAS domain S-box-containing protein